MIVDRVLPELDGLTIIKTFVVPDILSKTNPKISNDRKSRRYIKSSSFVMALLFTILCGLAALSIGYFINYFTKGHFVHSTESVLDAEVRYIEAVGADNVSQNGQLYLFLEQDGSLPDTIPSTVSRLTEGILVFDYPPTRKRYAAKF